MALKPNQLQVKPFMHKQMQSLSEYIKLWDINDMLKSFNLETIMKI
jgi:hypothetical protein